MKFVLDALGAPTNSGGMRLYADGVIRGWLEAHPEDELVLVGPKWLAEEFEKEDAVKVVHWSNDSAVKRALGQFLVTALVAWRTRSDAVISLSPVVTPLVRKSRRTCVVQDWRHINHPEEFGRAQLLYRKWWIYSVAHAGAVVTMSGKTQAETAQLVPRAKSGVVETGRDYVRYWPEQDPAQNDVASKRTIVTFGHHSNKRPELLVDALAILDSEADARVELVVLGARGAYREELHARATAAGTVARCVFPGFVDEAEYRRLVRSASVIALVSSDEGFGLPVAEANYLGVPALVTDDSGLGEIHSAGVAIAQPNAASVAKALRSALDGAVDVPPVGQLTTWAHTADGIRRAALNARQGS